MCKTIASKGAKREQGTPKITWKEVVSKDLQSLGIHANLAKNKVE